VKERFGGMLPSDMTALVPAEPSLLAAPRDESAGLDWSAIDWARVVQAFVGFVGVVAGALAAVYAYRQTSSWLLAAYAAVGVSNVIGRVPPHVVVADDRVRMALFFLIPPAVGTAILFVAYGLSSRWWLAVLLGCIGWIASRGITNAAYMRRAAEGVSG
jgi:hypothetical protein